MFAQMDASHGNDSILAEDDMPIFLDFALCGPDEFLPLSELRQSVSVYPSKAL
jgi:hypothetical protein